MNRLNDVGDKQAFQRCVDFHGHVCPGLAIGYRAAIAAMRWLDENRAEDEDLVAVVENDACGVDAFQVLTGCSFGKGNLIHKDYGKQAFSLLARRSGKGVRIALKDGALWLDNEHRALMQKIREGTATKEEQQTFKARHRAKSEAILGAAFEGLFDLQPTTDEIPAKAVIEPSERCGACGEPTMPSKMVDEDGKRVCRGCAHS
jgi:formylmethanofuran dehydrogenase subunit E